MIPPVKPSQRYFPQQKDPRLNEDLRLVYQMAYDAHDRADQLHSQLQDAHRKLAEAHGKLNAMAAKPDPGGPSSTKIGGIFVKGVPPPSAGIPTYIQGTGQFEHKTAAGAVSPPAVNSSPGVPGQIAFDGGFVYICIGNNSWKRATLSTF